MGITIWHADSRLNDITGSACDLDECPLEVLDKHFIPIER